MAINIALPDFFQDPLYQESQDVLFPLGKDILSGNIPDYYAPIGEYGGTELENLLALTNRDVTSAVNENMTRRNISRSGVGTSAIAKAVADSSTQLRWSDYSRALEGRESLLNTGLETVSGVRSSALDLTGQKNQFELSRSNLELQQAITNAQLEAEEKANKNDMWSDILSSGIGAISSLYGASQISGAITKLGSAGKTYSYGSKTAPAGF